MFEIIAISLLGLSLGMFVASYRWYRDQYFKVLYRWSIASKSLNMLLDLHDVNKPNFYGATIAFRCGGLIGGEVVKFPRPLSLIEAASYVGFIWSDICADAHAYEEDFDEPVRFRIVGLGGLVIPYRM